MIIKFVLTLILHFTLIYFLFKKYLKIAPIKLYKDEFTSFQRGVIVSGGGVLFIIIFFIFYFFYKFFVGLDFFVPQNIYIFFSAILLLGFVSYYDDKRDLDPVLRLIVQFICVYFSLATVPHIFSFFPIKISILIALLSWIYIINITNFVDGADAFCITIASFFFLTVLFICLTNNLNLFSLWISILILPTLIIFAIFNFPPAKMFMGDTGAIFLGYLIGYCIIELSFHGFYLYVLSAYAYPLLDCSISLFKKVLKGYLPWKRLGDYYFLMPKKRKNINLNFLVIEKKLLVSIFGLSIVNLFIIIFANYIKIELISLLCFATSFCLMQIYKKFKV